MKVKEALKELRSKNEAQLHQLLASNREKLREMRFKVSQNQLKNIREIRSVKKTIATILTLLNEKKIEAPEKADQPSSNMPAQTGTSEGESDEKEKLEKNLNKE